ncbi:hypothetical protein HDU86_007201 [Geranomyces michiganensis]|nr:hypothetical protein HDU86_007201 [Geranomyces michiganensis]
MTAAHLAADLRRPGEQGNVINVSNAVQAGLSFDTGCVFQTYCHPTGGPVVFQFGVDFTDDVNDELDNRIEEQESKCKAEINHHFTSVYFEDVYRFDNFVHNFLEPAVC